MNIRNLLNFTPIVGPVATFISQVVSAKKIGDEERGFKTEGARQKIKLLLDDTKFCIRINVISHLFALAICCIPAIAKTIPSFTPWVLGAEVILSVVQYALCCKLDIYFGVKPRPGQLSSSSVSQPAAAQKKQNPLSPDQRYLKAIQEKNLDQLKSAVTGDVSEFAKFEALKTALASPCSPDILAIAIEQIRKDFNRYMSRDSKNDKILKIVLEVKDPVQAVAVVRDLFKDEPIRLLDFCSSYKRGYFSWSKWDEEIHYLSSFCMGQNRNPEIPRLFLAAYPSLLQVQHYLTYPDFALQQAFEVVVRNKDAELITLFLKSNELTNDYLNEFIKKHEHKKLDMSLILQHQKALASSSDSKAADPLQEKK